MELWMGERVRGLFINKASPLLQKVAMIAKTSDFGIYAFWGYAVVFFEFVEWESNLS